MERVATKLQSVVDDLLLGTGSPRDRLHDAMLDLAAMHGVEVPEGEALERFRQLMSLSNALADPQRARLAATIHAMPEDQVRRMILLVRDLAACVPRTPSAPAPAHEVIPAL